MVINYITCYTYQPKDLLVWHLCDLILFKKKKSIFYEIAPQILILCKFNNICQEMDQVILSYKFCDREVFCLTEID